MKIDCLGHSCFKVTLKNGVRILFDPYDDNIGYKPSEVEADIVVVSHAHYDHNNLAHIIGEYTLVNKPGKYNFDDFSIEGFKTFHDCEKGALRGENTVFLVTVKGLRLCHMGDLGCMPDDDVINNIKGTEILMIPVGGNYTLDAEHALKVCEAISPNIIIPMHFKTPASVLDIAPVYDFLEAARSEYDVSHLGKCSFTVDKSSLKKRTRIMVMEYL